LANSRLVSVDDFVYLAILAERGNLTKTQIIELNAHEKPSGTEILKRLISGGLVEQYDDQHDRRSKRLLITEAGREALGRGHAPMGQVCDIVTAPLNLREKLQLLYLLRKLDKFHRYVYDHERDTLLDALCQLNGQLPETVE
jgi:DNA-binding MarR family transcriptional regulator